MPVVVCTLKFMYLCLQYLCLLTLGACNSDLETEKGGCPLWHVPTINGQCECSAHLKGVVNCDKQFVYVARGNCMTWNNSTNYAVVHTCPFSTEWDDGACDVRYKNTYRIPINISGSKLDDITCKGYKRRGAQCRQCIDGYGPAAFSDGVSCVVLGRLC